LSRTIWIGLLAVVTACLAACGGSSNRAVTGTVGVSAGVALTTDSNITTIQVGTTLAITAVVTNDTNNAGVTWSLSGVGSLSGSSNTVTTFVAPTSATGTVTATITATSIADSTKTAEVTIFVLGTPKIAPVVLFPSNQNVLYSASIAVAGGLAPYTWSVSSGALPDGITLTASTTSVTSITGTPTTLGSTNFTILVTDANNASDSITLTLPVNPETACLLQGQYAFLWSGYFNGSPATYAGSIQIAGDGTLSGIQDWKDSGRTTQGEAVTGTCSTAATNTGVLTLNSPNGSGQFTYAVTVPDSNGVIHGGRIALINAAENSGSGELTLQDSTAFSAAALAGSYAFGAIGDDSAGAHQGYVGRLSVDATGAVSAGRADANGSTPLTAVALTGSLSAPDGNGRGIASLSASGLRLVMTYYSVSANKLFIVDTDSNSGTPRLTGYMTRQTVTQFDATAFTTTTGVLSLWGASGTQVPITSLALGRLANGAVVGAGSGTADLLLDSMSHGVPGPGVTYTAGSYSVDADGRVAYTVSNADGVRNLVLYLDGPADGYALQQSSKDGLAGTLEAQSGAITDTLTGEFVGGTQFAAARAPVDLIPFSELSSGIFSSSYATGSYAIDPTTGRGFGTFQQTGVGTTVSSMYIVSPTKIDVMRYGTTTGSIENSMEWFVSQ
jgi:hypothetical protein